MKRLRNDHGFTLIELMVVILILGLLVAYVGPRVLGFSDKAKIDTSRAQISGLETALKLYKIDNGQYPSAEQGLSALVKKPTADPLPNNWKKKGYMGKRKLPKDPWGRDYQYANPTLHEENQDIDVYSLGPDDKSDEDDIGNWQSKN